MANLTPEEQKMYDILHAKKHATGERIVHVIQVLDGSTSMNHGKSITISTFNEASESLRQNRVGKTTATLLTFSNYVDAPKYVQADLDRIVALNDYNYETSGMTALYDAIGRAIELGLEFEGADQNAQFLLQIFTDGDENHSSTKYKDPRTLRALIEKVQATERWTITVAGPKGQIHNFVANLGLHAGNTHQYDPSSLQARSVTRNMFVASTANYMTNAAAGVTAMNSAYSSVAAAPIQKTDDPDLKVQQ